MWSVRFESVTKTYEQGGAGHHSIREDIASIGRRLARRPDPWPEDRMIVALDRVSVEIEQGTSSAIVGRNGAGKSTALRLISRVTYPSVGRVQVRGRVGALIEIGAGVHPELTGRENVRLYGSFLGLRRAEIRRNMDSIVEFAELGSQVDQAVKYYSSGMQLRLGFAIASFMQPEVLIVDESLAVGDSWFQAKCIARMNELGREGSTVLFVSHEPDVVRSLCTHAIWLDHGRVRDQGPIESVLGAYLSSEPEVRSETA